MDLVPNTTHPKPAPAPKKRLRKSLRRLAYVALGFLVIFLVIFFLLPVWISNDQGRTYVLQQINKNRAAKINIEDWSVGWFRGTELRNVTVTLPDGSRLLSCPRVNSELTLWGILWGHYNVGITRVDTAQFAITRYTDGSTSLDAFFQPQSRAAKKSPPFDQTKFFRTLRGSLQVGSAVVTLNSVATGQSLTYTDVKAAATIASPDAPFHIQISAVGGAGTPAPGDVNLSLNATLPALASWPPPPSAILADMELSATNFPTALACDYTHLDPAWQRSFGSTIEKLQFSNHVTPPLQTSRPTLQLTGSNGATIDAAMLLRAASDSNSANATATLSLPASDNAPSDFHAFAALQISPPLVQLLQRINPFLAAIQSGDGLLQLRLTEFNLTAGNEQNAEAIAKITFPTLTLRRAGFVDQLLRAAGDPNPSHAPTIPAEADPLALRLAAGKFSYDNFTITCARRDRLTFSGSVALDGTLNLLASAPTTGPGPGTLGSSHTDIPLAGTTTHPTITLPR